MCGFKYMVAYDKTANNILNKYYKCSKLKSKKAEKCELYDQDEKIVNKINTG